MVHALPLGVVLLAGAYLVLLAALTLAAPARATSFLLGFAATARAHYAELALRGLVGAAFVVHAAHVPHARVAPAFAAVGWVLLLTTLGLALVPWRRHRDFARRVVPRVARHPRLLGVASLALGALVLLAALG